ANVDILNRKRYPGSGDLMSCCFSCAATLRRWCQIPPASATTSIEMPHTPRIATALALWLLVAGATVVAPLAAQDAPARRSAPAGSIAPPLVHEVENTGQAFPAP